MKNQLKARFELWQRPWTGLWHRVGDALKGPGHRHLEDENPRFWAVIKRKYSRYGLLAIGTAMGNALGYHYPAVRKGLCIPFPTTRALTAVWMANLDGPLLTSDDSDDPEDAWMDDDSEEDAWAYAAAVVGGFDSLEIKMNQWHEEAEAETSPLQPVRPPKSRWWLWTISAIAACLLPLIIWNSMANAPSNPELAMQYFKPYPDIYSFRDAGTGKLQLAMAAYGRGDYAQASTRLAALHQSYPDSFEISFYLGISELGLQHWGAAERYLADIASDQQSALAICAQWYLALAYLGNGNVNAAAAEIDVLLELDASSRGLSLHQRQDAKDLLDVIE